MNLLDKITQRQAVVSVIGLGYVGLPLAVAAAQAGFPVFGIDIDHTKVEAINQGRSYVQDISAATLGQIVGPFSSHDIPPVGHLMATTDYNTLAKSDVVIICVPTPLSKTRDPDLSYIIAATDEIAQRLHADMLIILESTTYPGTTEELILPRLEEARSSQNAPLAVGQDFYLAFSPERIDPGRQDWTILNTPKVIGGVTPHCLKAACVLYGCIIQKVVPVSSSRAAEMVKLLENTFRAVNVALVNEVAIMCNRLGVDVWEVIEAAHSKPFGFMPFYPGPGLGGHCLPIDPHYLAWKLKLLNYNARFIQLAEEINFGMPQYVLDKIADALNDDAKALKNSRVLLLGVTYKANVNDLRESPALELIHLLRAKGSQVFYHDPYVPALAVDSLAMTSVPLKAQSLQNADCVVITTAHQIYNWNWVVENSRLIVDTRNAIQGAATNPARIIKL